MRKCFGKNGVFAAYDAILFFSIMMLATSALTVFTLQDIELKDWRHENEMTEYVNFALTSIIQSTIVIEYEEYHVAKPIVDVLVIELKEGIYVQNEIDEMDTVRDVIENTLRRDVSFMLDIRAHTISGTNDEIRLTPPIVSFYLQDHISSASGIDDHIEYLLDSGSSLYVSSTDQITFNDDLNNREYRMSITLWIWE